MAEVYVCPDCHKIIISRVGAMTLFCLHYSRTHGKEVNSEITEQADILAADLLTARIKAGGEKMREIKFRAWDDVHKEMFQVTSLGSAFSNDDSLKFGDGTPLMQYTGLKDKKGVEIYEGDIVNLLPDSYIQELATVEWDIDKASFIYRRISELELVNKQGVFVNWKPVEAIGNIYENPELLEVNNELD